MVDTTRRHTVACSTQDYDFFYDGLEEGRILIQCCENCAKLRNPPTPLCPHCHSLAVVHEVMSGNGTVFSYTVHHHPPIPGFNLPHPVGVIELDEGIRFTAGLDAVPLNELRIGLRVKAEFLRRGRVASVRFAKA
jgi:uncharacterized OB-fold protein